MLSFLNQPAASLVMLILFRITLLLVIAWSLHLMLRAKNPRWQVALWRMAIIGIAVVMLFSAWHRGWGPTVWIHSTIDSVAPWTSPSALPQETITPAKTLAESTVELEIDATSRTELSGSDAWNRNTTVTPNAMSDNQTVTSLQLHVVATALTKAYFIVAAILLFRLLLRVVRVQLMLRRSQPADKRLTDLVSTVARELGLGNTPRVLVSSVTSVPLATGLVRPVIILPTELSQRLSDQENRFLIAHECSHFKGRDLFWALAMRIVQILLWPHPLTWGMASAHRYACDLRCDGIAAGEHSASYSSMLAAMALELNRIALPPTAMAFLQRSEVVGRVRQIESGIGAERLSRVRRVFAAFAALVAIGVTGTIGVNASFPANPDEIDYVIVRVVDDSGKPVAGAKVNVNGLRARKESASAHGNARPTDWETDQTGIANVRYPKYVYEELETGQLILSVTHPDFVRHDDQGQSVDQAILIAMTPGRQARITAVDRSSGEQIKKRLFAMAPSHKDPGGFRLQEDGTLVTRGLDPNCQTLLLVSLPENGPVLFSDLIDLRSYPAGDLQIDDVMMSPGERFTGQLSDNVTRPIKNGHVGLQIAATLNTKPQYDNCIFWNDFVSIDEDGMFVFPSVPRDVDVQLSAIADGWVSRSPPAAEVQRRFPYANSLQHAQSMRDNMVISQLFQPADFEQVNLEMEPSATCRVKVVTDDGSAVPEVAISMSPNTAWSPGPGGIVGHYAKTTGILLSHLDETKQFVKDNPDQFSTRPPRYFVSTDAKGIAIVNGLPGKPVSIGATSDKFEMPASGGNPYLRIGNVILTPGATIEVTVTVQPKGYEVLGR